MSDPWSNKRYVSKEDRCPGCGAEWAYEVDGHRYSRVIGIYSWEADRTVAWQCPACSRRWDRAAVVPVGAPNDG